MNKSIFVLGPEGTFSDQAAQFIRQPSSQVHYKRTFSETLEYVSQHSDCVGVAPIENSTAGTVAHVQDLLVQKELCILRELKLAIQYALLTNAPLEDIQHCYAHPQAWEQASQYVTLHLSHATPQYTNSNIESGLSFEDASQRQIPSAAIVPIPFAQKHPNSIHATNIQDDAQNTTRFLVVQKRHAQQSFDFSKKKTSLFVECAEDHPGVLHEILTIFDKHAINLCRLESRPSKRTPWTYVFFLDFYNTPNTQACLDDLKSSQCQYLILGSYDCDQVC